MTDDVQRRLLGIAAGLEDALAAHRHRRGPVRAKELLAHTAALLRQVAADDGGEPLGMTEREARYVLGLYGRTGRTVADQLRDLAGTARGQGSRSGLERTILERLGMLEAPELARAAHANQPVRRRGRSEYGRHGEAGAATGAQLAAAASGWTGPRRG